MTEQLGSEQTPDAGDVARSLYANALVWDQHACLPFSGDATAVGALELYRQAGVTFVSINVGFDLTSTTDSLKTAAAFRRNLAARDDRYILISRVEDVHQAYEDGKLAVSFDLEGVELLGGDIALLEAFYLLGVRTVLIAYNHSNSGGGGCHDDPETGLTPFGRELVAEMNRLGIMVDASHCARRTTFDLFEISTKPVVFSHSVPLGIKHHARNISDEQMRACADTGGVVGINGVGIFLGENDASTEALVRAVDYAVEVIGPDHVGIGLDYVVDQEEMYAFHAKHPSTWPSGSGYDEHFPRQFASPTQLEPLTEALLRRGYKEPDVTAILGGNFLRVASQIWR